MILHVGEDSGHGTTMMKGGGMEITFLQARGSTNRNNQPAAYQSKVEIVDRAYLLSPTPKHLGPPPPSIAGNDNSANKNQQNEVHARGPARGGVGGRRPVLPRGLGLGGGRQGEGHGTRKLGRHGELSPRKNTFVSQEKTHLKTLYLPGAPSRVDPFSQAQGRAAAGGAQGHCRAGTKFSSKYFYKRKNIINKSKKG